MIRSLCLLSLMTALSVPAFAQDNAATGIEPEKIELGRKVSFEKDIRDFLELNCVACHYDGGAESRLVVENASAMIKGGKRGAGIVPGKPDESLIYLVAARKKAPHMPPLPNKVEAAALTARELGLLRQWILEGAESDSTSTGTVVQWQPVPTSMKATYALSLSPWADRIAAGRANQISVLNVHTGEESQLIDPALSAVQMDGKPMYPQGASQRDFVHSLAWNPNGRMIASGGFRTVRLWEQPANVQTLKTALGAVAADVSVNMEKGLAAIGTRQNQVLVRSLADGAEVKKLEGHTAAVTGVALTSDGATVISGSEDKTVRVWSLESGQVTRQFETPAPVHDLCLTLDGTKIITAHADNIIRVWTVAAPEAAAETVAPVLEIKGHGGPVTSVCLMLPAGEEVVSGSQDGTVRTWNLGNGSQTRSYGHGGPVVSVACRPDGQVLASGSSNNTAKLWRVANNQQIAEVRGNVPVKRAELLAVEEVDLAKQLVALADAASKDAEKNATERAEALKKAGEEKEKSTKAVEEQQKKTDEAKKKADEAQAVVDAGQKKVEEAQKAADEAKKLSDDKTDDEALKKAAADAAAALKTAQDELTKATEALKAPTEELKKQSDEQKKQEESLKSATRSLELATQADAKAKTDLEAAKAAHTQSQEKQTAIEAALKQAQEATAAAEKAIMAVAFSGDGIRLATSMEDGSITLWASENGQPLDVLSSQGGPVRVLAFTDARRLLAAGDDQHLTAWDANPDWQLVARLGAAADNPLDTSASPLVFRVLSLAFNPDGTLLATGGGDPSRSGELMLWDVLKRELVRTIEDAHSDTVFGLEFSHDGRQILSGAADKFVKIHDVATGAHVKSFEGHTHHVMDVSWKADGSELVSAGADNAIKVWNVETGEQKRTIAGYGKQVTAISYMGVSGNTISCGGDKTVRFHMAQNGSNFRNFGGATDFMYSADASRDQNLVVAGGEDGVIRIWNGQNGQVIRNFDPPAAPDTAQASAGQ